MFTTNTLFRMTLPELCTVPEYVIKPPPVAEVDGQASETVIPGVVVTAQVVEATLVTARSPQLP